jgi:glycosyltransferase involved in cell wall biosynthesis
MWPALLVQYARLIARSPDVSEVHITTLEEQILATALFARLGRRVTWSVHGPVGVRHNPLQRLLYLAAARRVSRIIAVSPATKATVVAAGVNAERVDVVPHGVDLPSDCAEPQRTVPVVGFVGRLEEVKDPRLFVDAARVALERGTSAHFVLYGEGTLDGRLRAYIREHGLDGRIDLAGHVDNASEIYRAIDVMMLTSRSEGLGFVLLEAGAAGVPVIVPAIDGMENVVVDGVTGLIRERTPAALGHAVLELSVDAELRGRMGAAARNHIAASFTTALMLDRTAAVLHEPEAVT